MLPGELCLASASDLKLSQVLASHLPSMSTGILQHNNGHVYMSGESVPLLLAKQSMVFEVIYKWVAYIS
jgi:hypothetical protein